MKKLILMLLSFAVVTGCTSNQNQAPPKPNPPEALTGRSAMYKIYIDARGWAVDARPYKLQSQPTKDNNGHDGKAEVWAGSFASASMHGSKPYTWSGTDSSDAPSRGINPGTQDPFTPGNDFDIQFFKVDSDKALEVAEKHGGDRLLGQSPDTPVVYLLDWNRSGNNLVWHVIYGNSRNDAKLVIDVDASTGEFIRKEQ
jgi:hypothetical protein